MLFVENIGISQDLNERTGMSGTYLTVHHVWREEQKERIAFPKTLQSQFVFRYFYS